MFVTSHGDSSMQAVFFGVPAVGLLAPDWLYSMVAYDLDVAQNFESHGSLAQADLGEPFSACLDRASQMLTGKGSTIGRIYAASGTCFTQPLLKR